MEKVQTKWTVDIHHSKIQFRVKHLAIASVVGTFKTFSGVVETEQEDFDGAAVSFEIAADSISTEHEVRDSHLRSGLFLNAEQFPKITYTGIMHKKSSTYELDGTLTFRGISKETKLSVEYNGIEKDTVLKNTRAGFEATAKINRSDFGITFQGAPFTIITEKGGLVVGEEIKFHFDIELIKLPVIVPPSAG